MEETKSNSLDGAYSQALNFARAHYENFPIVSILIPKDLRKHIAIVYWFARTADDIADEGNASEESRLEKMNEFESNIKRSLDGDARSGFEKALLNTVDNKKLTKDNFFDLISAFKQDIIKSRYADFNEILHYCNRSANPVGRIILELFNVRDQKANEYSDKICTGLQLTNFLQDTIIDYKKGRIYLAKYEMQNYKVSEYMFEQKENNHNLQQLVMYNVERINVYFEEGKKLLPFLNSKLRTEIRWTIAGGKAILEQIKKNDYDILNYRPKLSKAKMAGLLVKSIIS
ncbi:MAG: squalene synthase HpnC [Ignavibacteriaceae bacterium]